MRTLYILLVCILFGACKKTEVEDVDFDVSTPSLTYKPGDTVTFNFSGNPDNIVFYSGENGRKYEYKQRTTAVGTPSLQFTSFRQYGNQNNTLTLWASNDFNGIVSPENVQSGWKEITSLAPLSTGSDNTPSGLIDLSEFLIEGKPVYLAFKYVGFKSASSAQRTWTIKDFAINNLLEDGTSVNVATQATAGWTALNIKNPLGFWIVNTTLRIAGGAANSEDNEDWVISKPLYLNKVMPDAGVAIKDITAKLATYRYVYQAEGTYTASFLVSNATVNGGKQMLKEITIKVEDPN